MRSGQSGIAFIFLPKIGKWLTAITVWTWSCPSEIKKGLKAGCWTTSLYTTGHNSHGWFNCCCPLFLLFWLGCYWFLAASKPVWCLVTKAWEKWVKMGQLMFRNPLSSKWVFHPPTTEKWSETTEILAAGMACSAEWRKHHMQLPQPVLFPHK